MEGSAGGEPTGVLPIPVRHAVRVPSAASQKNEQPREIVHVESNLSAMSAASKRESDWENGKIPREAVEWESRSILNRREPGENRDRIHGGHLGVLPTRTGRDRHCVDFMSSQSGRASQTVDFGLNMQSQRAHHHHLRGGDRGGFKGTFHDLLQELAAVHEIDLSHTRSECARLRMENASLRAELGREAETSVVRGVRTPSKATLPGPPAPPVPAVPQPPVHLLPTAMPLQEGAPLPLLQQLDEVNRDRDNNKTENELQGVPLVTLPANSNGEVLQGVRTQNEIPNGMISGVSTVNDLDIAEVHSRSVMGVHRFLSFTKDFKALPVWKMEDLGLSTGSKRLKLTRQSTSARPSRAKKEEEYTIKGQSCMQPFIIHPSSFKRLSWDLLSMALLAYDIIMIPFTGAFDPEPTQLMIGMNWITLFFWSLDMPASILTGFQDGRHTVMKPSRILRRYFKTWFVLDCLIVGFDWALLGLGESDGGGGSAARLGRSLRTLRFVRTLRLIRLLKIKRILQEIQDQINTEALSICFGVAKIILVLVLANHIVACCWYGIGEMGATSLESGQTSWVVENGIAQRTLLYRYATSLHWSLTQFTPASMEVVPYNVTERLFSVIVLLFAMITFSSFVSILTASMAELRNISSDETRQFWLLRRYLRDWQVPRRFAMRIQRYLEYAYAKQRQRVQAKDVKLLALLSGPLHDELKYETLSVHLSVHPLFVSCESGMRIFSKSLAEMWLARGDCVFCCGEQASSMVFLSHGNFQYHLGEVDNNVDSLPSEKEGSLPEGQWVAEAVLWTPWLHLGDLMSLTESQVLIINSSQFGAAVQVHKPMWLGLRRYAEKFVQALNRLKKEELTDLLHTVMRTAEIVEEADFASGVTNDTPEEDEAESAFGRLSRSIWGRANRVTRASTPEHFS
uniref:Ion transport domain-containing protein n=1 Tax=Alexandrium monilatum TaxID=311494 RepID=A0A7S4PY19_9DINO